MEKVFFIIYFIDTVNEKIPVFLKNPYPYKVHLHIECVQQVQDRDMDDEQPMMLVIQDHILIVLLHPYENLLKVLLYDLVLLVL